jgi:hypothetical protein
MDSRKPIRNFHFAIFILRFGLNLQPAYTAKEFLMNHARFLVLPLFLLALLASAASAQVRTFVASTGSDANPCSRVAPCRTFQAAVNAAAPGGEVVALDSAGFGSNVTITNSISIIAPPGVYAGITVFSGDGVDINAGSSDTVILRGLTLINQGSPGGSGIAFNTGGTLHVESCVVNGFGTVGIGGDGVRFGPSGSGVLEVKDSIMRANRLGISVFGNAQAVIDHVALERCGDGLVVSDGATATVRDSVASGNVSGFFVLSSTGLSAAMNLESCVASNNSVSGVRAITTSTGIATARVSNSTVTDNHFGLHNLGPISVMLSRGNNTVEGNTTNTSGTIGSYTAK